MATAVLGPYSRTIVVVAVLLAALGFALSGARLDAWAALQPFFEWMETTPFGVIGKTWGAAFAIVEAFHLLAMALLGGAVLLCEGRLLGLFFSDTPARKIVDETHRLFVWSLLVIVLTGVFMACGVAMKIYYMEVYWYKMLALSIGVLFVFFIKQPLLQHDIDSLNPWVVRMVAISSLMVWFTVAACGRWIGFSG